MWLKDKLLSAGQVLLSFWVVALGLVLGLGAIVAAVAIPIAGAGAVLKYTPLSSVPGINYIIGILILLLVWRIINKVGYRHLGRTQVRLFITLTMTMTTFDS